MKTRFNVGNPFLLWLSALGLPASAQTYSIDWHTIDDGGARVRAACNPSAGGFPATNGGSTKPGRYALYSQSQYVI